MKTSDSIDKLAPAICEAQRQVKHAVKDSVNPAFRSKYADLGSVWDAVRIAVQGEGLAVIQLPVHSEDGRVHLTTRLQHHSGQWLEETASIPVTKQDAHGYGSGLTYLRRYSLASMLGVVSDDDDGNAAVETPKGPNGKGKTGFEESSKTVARTEFERMSPDEQTEIQLHASLVVNMKDPVFAEEYIFGQEHNFTHEQIAAIWGFLDSKQRAAITKVRRPALATQA